MRTIVRRSASRQRSLAGDLFMALFFGLLGALAKRYLDFSIGVPGHAGVGWIAVLIAGRLMVPRVGLSTLTGVSMGFWGEALGLGHSLGFNVLLYGLAGSILDSGVLLRFPLRRSWGAALAGSVVHVAKYGFVFANAWISDLVRRVEVYGFLAALGNHVAFGILGGFLGWVLWRGARTMPVGRRSNRPT